MSPAAPLARRLAGAFAGLPRRGLVGLLRGYRLLLSPWIGNQCRFFPTCSVYGIEALQRHGALAGSYLTAARVLRCHPWCAGGCDPVPRSRPRLFRHLLPHATTALPSDPTGPDADAVAAPPAAGLPAPLPAPSSDLSGSLP